MTHETCQERLLDLMYGELKGAEKADVQSHLDGCDTCRRELESLAGTRRLMRALPAAAAPAAADHLILTAAREAVRQRAAAKGATKKSFLPTWVWRLSFTAALALLVGGVSFSILRSGANRSAPAEEMAYKPAPEAPQVREPATAHLEEKMVADKTIGHADAPKPNAKGFEADRAAPAKAAASDDLRVEQKLAVAKPEAAPAEGGVALGVLGGSPAPVPVADKDGKELQDPGANARMKAEPDARHAAYKKAGKAEPAKVASAPPKAPAPLSSASPAGEAEERTRESSKLRDVSGKGGLGDRGAGVGGGGYGDGFAAATGRGAGEATRGGDLGGTVATGSTVPAGRPGAKADISEQGKVSLAEAKPPADLPAERSQPQEKAGKKAKHAAEEDLEENKLARVDQKPAAGPAAPRPTEPALERPQRKGEAKDEAKRELAKNLGSPGGGHKESTLDLAPAPATAAPVATAQPPPPPPPAPARPKAEPPRPAPAAEPRAASEAEAGVEVATVSKSKSGGQDSVDSLIAKANAALQSNHDSLAEQLYQAAYDRDHTGPRAPDALLGLARCRERAGDAGLADVYYARLFEGFPASPAWRQAGEAHLRLLKRASRKQEAEKVQRQLDR